MKILIAGGAGFIGSHLNDALLREGHTVVCVDNFYNGTREQIAHCMQEPRFIFYECDLCRLEDIQQVFQAHPIDAVFHLAANSDIQASAGNPMLEYQHTYTTTFHLLECMRLFEVKRLFFASTSAVYGEKRGAAVSEETPGLAPISYYGGAKLGAEAMIQAYSFMNDFSSLIFRFPNVIGPRLTHGVIYDFIRKLTDHPEELEILGDGRQAKPYLHVEDLISGILQRMNGEKGTAIYNIGVETKTSVTRIADFVCQAMGLQDVRYRYTGGRCGWKGDVPEFSYNLEKIHRTGWRARYTSDEAVQKTCREVVKCRR